MSDDSQIFAAAAELSRAGKPFVLITVTSAKGSTPRNAGAKMLWQPGSDGLHGTVGGGQFELLVLDAAAKCLETRSCTTERFVLGADADQCCGGVMEVFLEYHGARQRLVIFGAGHVSHALVNILDAAPLETVVVDDRPDWNSAERFPATRRVTSWDDGIRLARERPQATLACVMTCSHDTDFQLLRMLLATDTTGAPPPAFTGLIGSKSKRVCLFGRLVASGLDDTLVKTIHCPIGVGDTGKEPKLVAISMAAQLLMEANKIGQL